VCTSSSQPTYIHTDYRSLEARKELREAAWQLDGWAETVSKVRDAQIRY
jgi:hypothetical protein